MTAPTTSTHHAAPATAKERASKNRPSSVGAPAQRSQTSRKGKRAWRKNVDLEEVEEGLEELRAEERLTGYVPWVFMRRKKRAHISFLCLCRTSLQKKKDEELFHVDVVGDDQSASTYRPPHPAFSSSMLRIVQAC